eukprot:Hpha_TRINITY_DN2170_c0_g1::TRINITY_DN2170_c0_g1_i1::g.42203::m.42203
MHTSWVVAVALLTRVVGGCEALSRTAVAELPPLHSLGTVNVTEAECLELCCSLGTCDKVVRVQGVAAELTGPCGLLQISDVEAGSNSTPGPFEGPFVVLEVERGGVVDGGRGTPAGVVVAV